MTLHLQSDDFELFCLPRRFAQDASVMQARWKQLQRQAHPDRFAAQGALAQRLAMQWSVRINEAWQRLKDPLKRAAYLCELRGAPINAENNTAMPAEFLMQQIQWREALDACSGSPDGKALDALADEVRQTEHRLLAACAHLLDEADDASAAAAQVRALLFVTRFARDIEHRRAQQQEQGAAP